MIPFNLEKALAGEKVVTRDGRPITQLVNFKTYSGNVLYGFDCDNDHVEQWLVNGDYHDSNKCCDSDLFMEPKKLSGFVVVYSDGITGNIHIKKESAQLAIEQSIKGKGVYGMAIIDLSDFEEGHGL